MMDNGEETKTIVKLINAQYFGKGFTYGMVKTVDMIKKDPDSNRALRFGLRN